MGRLRLSPRRGPHGNGHCLRLPAGKDLRQEGEKRSGEQREEVRGADCGGHRSCFGFPPRTILAPRLSSVVRPAPAGDLCVSPGVPGQPQGTGTVLEPREEGRDGALLLVNLKPDNVLF